MRVSNVYIDYYGKNSISPVNQDISNFETHVKRRQKLYRQCGIPTFAFADAEVLEVGPGGGHNALSLFQWGIKHIDLIEPNPTGVKTIQHLFDKYNIDSEKYTIHNIPIEVYRSDKKYDIVLAEGFLMYVPNWREICDILSDFTRVGGVVVVASADDISLFIELMKRLIGQAIARDYNTLEEKVNALIPVFDSQLSKLRGASRPTRDWIYDNVFNPAQSHDFALEMGDLIRQFRGFDLIGSSPKMFTDYSWYKDIWFDEKEDQLNQFRTKHLSLVLAGTEEIILNPEDSDRIASFISEVKRIENEWEKSQDEQIITKLAQKLIEGKLYMECMPGSFVNVYTEIVDAVLTLSRGEIPNMGKYNHFFGAFGRGEQYLGFMKSL